MWYKNSVLLSWLNKFRLKVSFIFYLSDLEICSSIQGDLLALRQTLADKKDKDKYLEVVIVAVFICCKNTF